MRFQMGRFVHKHFGLITLRASSVKIRAKPPLRLRCTHLLHCVFGGP